MKAHQPPEDATPCLARAPHGSRFAGVGFDVSNVTVVNATS
jgi:hypothetical protein